ncbi:hypothetical protein [Sutcliffiella horikoshii]|uniref:hypothetical protein n=1 Tax=Sutcliffiella horikoshii TaxID=79883 RepID=UPI003CF749C0
MRFIDDLFFLLGILLIIVPTFLLNVIIGCYVLGVFFLVSSILLASKEAPKRE